MGDLRAFLVRATLDEAFRELVLAEPERAFEGYELSADERAILRRRDHAVLALIGKVLAEETAERPPVPRPAPAAAPRPAQPVTQLPDLRFELTVSPTRVGDTLAYRASIAPADVRAPRATPPTDPVWGHRLGSPAAHRAARAVHEAPAGARLPALLALVASLKDESAEETEAPPTPAGGQPAITVVGLGIKNLDHLTVEADRALRSARRCLYLDTGLATRELLAERCPDVVALYAEAYTEGGSRLDAYHHVAARVVEAALEGGPVAFAIQGHPSVFCYPPHLVRDLGRMLGLGVEILPGISAFDCLVAELGIDPAVHGMQMFEATDLLLRRRPLAPDVPALIWQVGTVETRLHTRRVSAPGRLDRLASWLLGFYPPEHPVTALFSAPHPLVPSTRIELPLARIGEHARALHPGFTMYLPPIGARPVFDLELLARLDSPEHLDSISG